MMAWLRVCLLFILLVASFAASSAVRVIFDDTTVVDSEKSTDEQFRSQQPLMLTLAAQNALPIVVEGVSTEAFVILRMKALHDPETSVYYWLEEDKSKAETRNLVLAVDAHFVREAAGAGIYELILYAGSEPAWTLATVNVQMPTLKRTDTHTLSLILPTARNDSRRPNVALSWSFALIALMPLAALLVAVAAALKRRTTVFSYLLADIVYHGSLLALLIVLVSYWLGDTPIMVAGVRLLAIACVSMLGGRAALRKRYAGCLEVKSN